MLGLQPVWAARNRQLGRSTAAGQVSLTGWATVEMGGYRVAARRNDGTFYYWGVNADPSPTQVAGSDWALADVTGFGECGIKTNGTLHCTLQGVAPAFQAGSATDWVSIVGPGYPYFALNSQGAVGCFVNNGSNTGFNSSPAGRCCEAERPPLPCSALHRRETSQR